MFNSRSLLLALASVFIVSAPVFADATARPDAHAPIGVMGEHLHKKGEWMTSYRYMHMDMNEHYSGVKRQSINTVLQDYVVSPVRMKMEMHMVGVMYGLTDELTAMFMLPYVIKDMEHRNRMNRQFSTRASGLGDIKLTGMYSLRNYIEKNVHLNLGVSFPTGSINRHDQTLLGKDQPLPYPMQLGSGTHDLIVGGTFNSERRDNWSWGAQAISVVRKGKNSQGYHLGDNHEITTWISYVFNKVLSSSLRLDANMWGNVNGADPRINPIMIPTADGKIRSGKRIDALVGINLIGQEGIFKDHRLAFEFGMPVYQDLKGPQLGVGYIGTFGWQRAF